MVEIIPAPVVHGQAEVELTSPVEGSSRRGNRGHRCCQGRGVEGLGEGDPQRAQVSQGDVGHSGVDSHETDQRLVVYDDQMAIQSSSHVDFQDVGSEVREGEVVRIQGVLGQLRPAAPMGDVQGGLVTPEVSLVGPFGAGRAEKPEREPSQDQRPPGSSRSGRNAALPLLAVVAGVAACAEDPWETEPPFLVAADVLGASDDVVREDLRLVYRMDVFRPANFSPRGHRLTRDCEPREQGSGSAPAFPFCTDLRFLDDGKTFLETVHFLDAEALLRERGAILDVVHASHPNKPLFLEVGSAPLRAEVTFSGLDRYWAQYWAKCEGCLGLAWVEARVAERSWCAAPTWTNEAGAPGLLLTVTLTEPSWRQTSGTESSPRCGNRSWFEVVHYDENGKNQTRTLPIGNGAQSLVVVGDP
jgi:hypothetical protein